jgi:NhaP-type Na+/H+ or K+/H+ antiporter
MIDEITILMLLALIILLGYFGHIFFEKTKVPHFLLLVVVGIVINLFGVFDKALLIPIVGLFSTLTLIMVTFYSGLNLDLYDIVYQSGRAFLQSFTYIGVSVVLIAFSAHMLLGWPLLESFIFSSMTGGEITAAVVVPLAFSLGLRENVKALLTLETAISTILTIVLFFMFLNQWIVGETEVYGAVISIVSNFTIAIFFGMIFSLVSIRLLYRFRRQEYTYVLIIGLLLLIYTIVKALGGNGELAALILGLFLSNNRLLSRMFGMGFQADISMLIFRLNEFQEEISFLFETLFFVFLGMVFVINFSTILTNLMLASIFVLILIVTRFLAVSLANFGSDTYNYRLVVTVLCAQGIVPASLSIYLLRYDLALKYTFMSLITYIIILTNVITTVGIWIISRSRHGRLY